jgi:hypothetical protein
MYALQSAFLTSKGQIIDASPIEADDTEKTEIIISQFSFLVHPWFC